MILRPLLFGLLALLAACATPAEPTNMVVTLPQASFPPAFAGAMCVRSVTGGEETNPLWVSKVSDTDFRAALARSMAAAGLIGADAGCRFPVDVNLLGLAQPAFGINLEVTSHVNYKVFGPAGQPVLLETVTAAYTAGFSDSPIAIIRLRLANEGAIRASITRFLEKLRTVAPPVADVAPLVVAASAPPPDTPPGAARCRRPGTPAPRPASSADPPAAAGIVHRASRCTGQPAGR